MKKRIVWLFLFFSMSFTVLAHAETTAKKVFTTDITAYINEQAIPSYIIDGKMAINMNDLLKYGFEINILLDYPNLYRIECYGNTGATKNNTIEKNTQNTGTLLGYAYPSDKIIQINGNEIECYVIDGKSMILMDSLKYCGNVTWYPEQRKTCFQYVSSINDIYHIDEFIYRFAVELTKNDMGVLEVSENDNYYLEGLSLGHDKQKGIYFKVSAEATTGGDIIKSLREMFYDMLGKDKQNIAFANEHIKTTINGEMCDIVLVEREYREKYFDYYFYLDSAIHRVSDINSIRMEYK